ncbi:MAG: acyltransferase [Candidatus Paceibacterota bacterium]|jgi:acetyltransferase-like isoleucine patch superfamily enzyme
MIIGENSLIRSGAIIYDDVKIGDNFVTGHNVLIREHTTIGNNVKVGSSSIIEGNCYLGNDINIQSMVFIPTKTAIGDNVFIGPCVTMTNDKYPPSKYLGGPSIMDGVVIGACAIILPGVKLGKGCFVAAGSLVTKNVPAGKMAIGYPARIVDKPMVMK